MPGRDCCVDGVIVKLTFKILAILSWLQRPDEVAACRRS